MGGPAAEAGVAVVLVAGAGPVGATLALALAASGVDVALVHADGGEATPASPRPIALSRSSVCILRTLGVWARIAPDACPISMVHVCEQGRFGMVRLRARELGVDALGQVTDAAFIAGALDDAVRACPRIRRLGPARVADLESESGHVRAVMDPATCDAPAARLLACADGGVSPLAARLGIVSRHHEYLQSAVVCDVTPGRDHQGVAYERFTRWGPLALLPLVSGRCALVWTLPRDRAGAVAALEDAAFLAALQQAFGHRLGELRAASPRRVFPLALVSAETLVGPRLALAGNAANRLHPVAGQGLNLGLRDAATLAEVIAGAVRRGEDPGDAAVLGEYQRRRRPDQRAVVRLTHMLARGFTVSAGPLGTLRSAGMLALDLVPPASRAFARRAMGLAGRQPRLVRGLLP